jgi:hypothetical protein
LTRKGFPAQCQTTNSAAVQNRPRIRYALPDNQADDMDANPKHGGAPQLINGRINGRFAPGFSGNPGGSPEATRRLVNKAFLEALAEDFRKGGPQAIAKVRKYQPAAYMKICALLVPRELQVEHSGGVKAMTDEQLERGIALIKEMLAKRAAGANAKVIEGVAEPVPAVPPPSRKARRKVRRSDRAESGLAARVVDAEPTNEVRQPPRGQVSPSKSP